METEETEQNVEREAGEAEPIEGEGGVEGGERTESVEEEGSRVTAEEETAGAAEGQAEEIIESTTEGERGTEGDEREESTTMEAELGPTQADSNS